MTDVSLGQPVPEFTATATSGKQVSLAEGQGKYRILYFYP